ncbi:hypothetical protein Hypma_003750 [Hypsizygus marmoreus]|uniref:Uncharacterized protein n=1 Tax=Hypsizygus marmoreus TaxID=39966 RepID=A0A369J1I9_HYPMA|nr:hypothetical protein Hypma_003750 [Hypsizygus marmoreus]
MPGPGPLQGCRYHATSPNWCSTPQDELAGLSTAWLQPAHPIPPSSEAPHPSSNLPQRVP